MVHVVNKNVCDFTFSIPTDTRQADLHKNDVFPLIFKLYFSISRF